jgi:hypothetical protein
MNKYIFFHAGYKPICMARYETDEEAIKETEELANETGELVIVCRHLTQRALDASPRAENQDKLSGSRS